MLQISRRVNQITKKLPALVVAQVQPAMFHLLNQMTILNPGKINLWMRGHKRSFMIKEMEPMIILSLFLKACKVLNLDIHNCFQCEMVQYCWVFIYLRRNVGFGKRTIMIFLSIILLVI